MRYRVLSIVAVLIIAGDWALSVMVYNENFNQRFENYEPLMLYVDDYDRVQRTYILPRSKSRYSVFGF